MFYGLDGRLVRPFIIPDVRPAFDACVFETVGLAGLAVEQDPPLAADTFGLNLVTTKANGGIAFTNSGAVTSNQNVNALQIDGNGGAVTYGGAGSITPSIPLCSAFPPANELCN